MNSRKLSIKQIVDAETANAFLFSLIFNQNQRAEQSWDAPHKLKKRLGTLDPERILKLASSDLMGAISERPALHPFIFIMTEYIYAACRLLRDKYACDARNIWRHRKSIREVLKRLQEFHGIGKHKATVGVFLLKNELRVDIVEDGTRLNIRTTCPSLYRLYGEGEWL